VEDNRRHSGVDRRLLRHGHFVEMHGEVLHRLDAADVQWLVMASSCLRPTQLTTSGDQR